MKTVADVMGVARSHLAEKARRDQQAPSPESPFPRGPYAKPEDIVLLPAIRELVSARQTYGYRRITALLNRKRGKEGLEPVNRKRVLRIMPRFAQCLRHHAMVRVTGPVKG
jgi:hypothetical protein